TFHMNALVYSVIDTMSCVINTHALHDALPILFGQLLQQQTLQGPAVLELGFGLGRETAFPDFGALFHQRRKDRHREPGDFLLGRSEEHTSELQSRENIVCRLLLEKKELSEKLK